MNSKPFGKLVHCYLLDAIGELANSVREDLARIEPKLQGTFRSRKTWAEIVADEMDFPADFPDQVRALWQSNLQIAKASGTTIDPNEFVELLIRENFPYALE